MNQETNFPKGLMGGATPTVDVDALRHSQLIDRLEIIGAALTKIANLVDLARKESKGASK